MTATTDFVPYATQTGANVEAQATYIADPQTALGQQAGIASSANANKAWRQGTFQAALLATFVATVLNINVPDDGNLTTALTNLENALATFVGQYTKTFLTADLNVYVATTGSDTTGNGTEALPWATLQHAYNYVQQYYDLSGFSVTVNVAAGTYTAGVAVLSPTVGGVINFVGSPGSPDTVVISVSDGNCFTSGIGNSLGGAVTINGFKLEATGLAANEEGFGLVTGVSGTVGFENVDFGTCTASHMWTGANGVIYGLGPYTVSGGAQNHWLTTDSGGVIQISSQTITLTGTPAFSIAFANASNCGVLGCDSNTYTGTATGTQYSVAANGVIITGNAGTTLPGNADGSTATGGQLL